MSYIAIDCEMVGDINNMSILAKVTLVDINCSVIYDTFVKPTAYVSYYRNTGFELHQLNNGKSFLEVQNEVQKLIRGKILVGHSVDADLRALGLTHSRVKDIADHYKKNNQRQTLACLAAQHLGIRIQTGAHHDSREDAITAMKIYKQNPF